MIEFRRHDSIFNIIWATLFFVFAGAGCVFSNPNDSRIIVNVKEEKGRINPYIFGNNLTGYDPMTYENWAAEYYGYSDYGAGIWNPKENRSNPEMIELMKNAGITVVRFPGGCGTHHYDWKKAIGKDRKHFRFGIDEFMKVAREIGAEPIFTISYFTGNAHDQADLIEYLNSPDDGQNLNGGIDWAHERTKNGYKDPYNVKYFEIGNEVWHGDHHDIKTVSARDYAEKYVIYYEAFKAVDPQVQIGVLLNDEAWDQNVLDIIGKKLDFGIMHYYFSAGWAGKDLMGKDPKKIFFSTINEPRLFKAKIQKKIKMMKRITGRDILLAITEYNTAFTQNEPLPYRHTLGAALVNAEILRFFMDPENKILMANYWEWSSQFWGMVNNFYPVMQKNIQRPYVKRPNYYVYELFQQFGERLLKTRQTGNEKFLFVQGSRSEEGDNICLVVVNANMEAAVTSLIDLKNFIPKAEVDVWVLNGPSIESTNEKDHELVAVTHKKIIISEAQFEFSFEPHSLTMVKIYKD